MIQAPGAGAGEGLGSSDERLDASHRGRKVGRGEKERGERGEEGERGEKIYPVGTCEGLGAALGVAVRLRLENSGDRATDGGLDRGEVARTSSQLSTLSQLSCGCLAAGLRAPRASREVVVVVEVVVVEEEEERLYLHSWRRRWSYWCKLREDNRTRRRSRCGEETKVVGGKIVPG
jgi:hypothetical protein